MAAKNSQKGTQEMSFSPASTAAPATAPLDRIQGHQGLPTQISPGSAEHVSSHIRGRSLSCPHFPKYQVDGSNNASNRPYPSRLGFFHASSSEIRISYLDTSKMCIECLASVVPFGYNFWSTFIEATKHDDSQQGLAASTTKRGWLNATSPDQNLLRITQAGTEGFPPLPLPSRFATNLAVVPAKAIFMPHVASAWEAWEWLTKEGRPFYMDQLHLVKGWNFLAERRAEVDAKIAQRNGIPFTSLQPSQAKHNRLAVSGTNRALTTDISSNSHVKTLSEAERLTSRDKKISFSVEGTENANDAVKSSPIVSNGRNDIELHRVKDKTLSTSSSTTKRTISPNELVNHRPVPRGRAQVALAPREARQQTAPPSTSIGSPVASDEIVVVTQTIKDNKTDDAAVPVKNAMEQSIPTRVVSPRLVALPQNQARPSSPNLKTATNKPAGPHVAEISQKTQPSKPRPDTGDATVKSTSEQEMLKQKSTSISQHKKKPSSKQTADHSLSMASESPAKPGKTQPKKLMTEKKHRSKAHSDKEPSAASQSSHHTSNWCRHSPIHFDDPLDTPSLDDYKRYAATPRLAKISEYPLPLRKLLDKLAPKGGKRALADNTSDENNLLSLIGPRHDSGKPPRRGSDRPVVDPAAGFVKSVLDEAISNGRGAAGKPLINGLSINRRKGKSHGTSGAGAKPKGGKPRAERMPTGHKPEKEGKRQRSAEERSRGVEPQSGQSRDVGSPKTPQARNNSHKSADHDEPYSNANSSDHNALIEDSEDSEDSDPSANVGPNDPDDHDKGPDAGEASHAGEESSGFSSPEEHNTPIDPPTQTGVEFSAPTSTKPGVDDSKEPARKPDSETPHRDQDSQNESPNKEDHPPQSAISDERQATPKPDHPPSLTTLRVAVTNDQPVSSSTHSSTTAEDLQPTRQPESMTTHSDHSNPDHREIFPQFVMSQEPADPSPMRSDAASDKRDFYSSKPEEESETNSSDHKSAIAADIAPSHDESPSYSVSDVSSETEDEVERQDEDEEGNNDWEDYGDDSGAEDTYAEVLGQYYDSSKDDSKDEDSEGDEENENSDKGEDSEEDEGDDVGEDSEEDGEDEESEESEESEDGEDEESEESEESEEDEDCSSETEGYDDSENDSGGEWVEGNESYDDTEDGDGYGWDEGNGTDYDTEDGGNEWDGEGAEYYD